MDSSLNNGLIRWQKKQNDSSNSMDSNCSLSSSNGQKTPVKTKRSFAQMKTPNKTPGTPGRPGSQTPNKCSGDRFIPCRSATKFNLAHHLIVKSETESAQNLSPSQQEYQKIMSENLNGSDMSSSKIIAYRNKAPTAPDGHQNNLKVLYSQNKVSCSAKKTTRHIPQVPERILDAPDIIDDYYLNLLDWSCNNQLAVCLGGQVYIWNATSGEIAHLMEMEDDDEYIASVAWTKEGHCLALGTSNGDIQLWDAEHKKRLRVMSGHASRVGALSWNSHVLSSGCRSGALHHHDVRVASHHIGSNVAHNQELCGLSWSRDARYLASGGNDNMLYIWDRRTNGNIQQPLYAFSQHQAAVKALSWCPWQSGLLASGGGTADRHIRFWNCNTGDLINSMDTNSQVCSLLWSQDYRELISSHGYAQNQLIIWKYPTMNKVAELTGHTARVLHMSMSPDGSTVVSAAADETLRLWKCFQTDPNKKKASQSTSRHGGSSILRKGIR